MLKLPVFFDHLLALPMPLLMLFILSYWSFFAFIVHRFLVPWIAGRTGQKIGRLEAEVPAQIGLAFGLLVSFITIPVWEQHSLAEDTARSEAASYRDIEEIIEESPKEIYEPVHGALQKTVDFIVTKEWPLLAHLQTPRVASPPLRDLRNTIHALPEGVMKSSLLESFKQATNARETRLRIAATRPPPARWGIIGVLAILTLLGVGLIHADAPRARRIALGMVAIGISCCFVILFAYTRPYLGQFAIEPEDMRVLSAYLSQDNMSSHLTKR